MIKVLSVLIFFAVSFFVVRTGEAALDHQLLTDVLKEHVSDGRVDYKDLCADARLDAYLKEVASAQPGSLPPQEELALWLNAYNGYMLKVVCDHYPLKSLNQLHFGGIVTAAIRGKTVWDRPVAVVGGETYDLKTIDHGIIRTKFKDPRLQFGMSCGAVSCPDLRAEAYEAAKLDDQLEDQARKFFNDPRLNVFDLAKKKAMVSPLLNSNSKYFAKDRDGVFAFAAQYLPEDIALSLKEHLEEWTIKYGKYDLTVNDRH